MGLHVYPPLRCFQTVSDILNSPFVSEKEFDRLFERWLGTRNFLYTYRARNGLFHLLVFLKKRGVKKVFVPGYTCREVVHPIKKSGLSIEFADNSLDTLGIDDSNIKLGKTDAILLMNYFGVRSKPSKRTLESGAVIIEDNASFFKRPSKYTDFTLYSFGKGKEFSSSEGGVVTVNNKSYTDFLSEVKLHNPSFMEEVKRFLDYLIWRLGTLRLLYGLSRSVKSIFKTGESFEFGDIENNNLGICKISKKLAYRQLSKYEGLQKKSSKLWEGFTDRVEDITDIEIVGGDEDSNFFSVNMLVNNRDDLKKFLEKKGVFASIPWNYNIGKGLTGKNFENAGVLYSKLLQLKIDPTYMADDDIEYIAKCFREFYKS